MKHKTLVAVILILAGALRIAGLDRNPAGFYCDEAAEAYTASYLAETGRNLEGEFLPRYYSQNLAKNEATEIYLMALFIKILGLNVFAARLGLALAGTATVLLLYLLVREMADRETAVWAMLLLAVSPWHIQFSRMALRSALFPCFFVLALWLLRMSLRRPGYLFLCAGAFLAAMHTYFPSRVFTPLFMLAAAILYWRHLWNHRRLAILAAVPFLAVFAAMSSFWISGEGMTRMNVVMQYEAPRENRIAAVAKNYLSYYSPAFLFSDGDSNLRHSAKGVGELLWVEAFLLPLGFLGFALRRDRRTLGIVLAWFALYPLPAAIVTAGHAQRAIIGAPLFALISGEGAAFLIALLRSFARPGRAAAWLAAAICIVAAYNTRIYFVNYPRDSAMLWQNDIRLACEFAEKEKYDHVILSYNLWDPLFLIMFFDQYPPEEFLKIRAELYPKIWEKMDYSVGKYTIAHLDRPELEIPAGRTVIFARREEGQAFVERGARELERIQGPHGETWFRVFEMNGAGGG